MANLKDLNPIVKDKVEQLQTIMDNKLTKYKMIITQGFRSMDEQAKLYAQGRTAPGHIVTNARPGTSYHNYGLAVDFALVTPDGKKAVWDVKSDFDHDGKADWMEVVAEAKKLGFEWGGDWTSFKDMPHLQITFGLSIKELMAGMKPPTSVVKHITKKSTGIKSVGKIKIVDVKHAAYIVDAPSVTGENLSTIDLGKTIDISGSVPGWWEVIYNGKRAYVNEKFGKKVK
jgi:peptidoglycan L-alanyl-D-glutamate endopeptidase CwlK